MALDSFNISDSETRQAPSAEGLLRQFTDAFSHEARLQTFALAQTVGLGDTVGRGAEPEEADGQIAKHAQMFGRAAADLLPVVATGFLTRYGFGKVFSAGNEVATGFDGLDKLLLRRSSIGLSAGEAATTGLVTGALLKPTDDNASRDLASFVADRAKSGVINAASFAVMSGLGSGASGLAARTDSTIVRAALANPISNGVLTGAIGGAFNAELDSVASTGKLTFDSNKVIQSAYQMALVGGTFGAASSLARRSSDSVDTTQSNSTKGLAETKMTTTPKEVSPIAGLPAADGQFKSITGVDFAPSPRRFDLSAAGMGSQSIAGLSFSDAGFSPPQVLASLEPTFSPLHINSDVPSDNTEVNSSTRQRPTSNNDAIRADKTPSKIVASLDDPNSWEKITPKKSLSENEADSNHFNLDRRRALDALSESLGTDSQLVKDIAALPPDKIDLPTLSRYILKEPANERLVSAMLEANNGNKLSTYILEPYKGVIRELGLRREDVKRLSDLEDNGLDLAELNDYLQGSTDAKKDLIYQKFRDGASSRDLSPEQLRAVDTIQDIYGEDSFESHSLLSMRNADLSSIASFIENGSSSRYAVSKLLDASAPRSFFDPTLLSTFEALDRKLNLTEEETSKIVSFGSHSLTLLSNLPEYITQDTAPRVRELLKTTDTPAELTPDRLASLNVIERHYGRDSIMIKDILILEKQGLNLWHVSSWITDHGNNPFYDNLIKSGATVKDLLYHRAVAVEQLASMLSDRPESLQRILSFEKEGLNLRDLHKSLTAGFYTLNDLEKIMNEPGATAADLNNARIRGIKRINEILGQDSDITKKILQSEKSGA